MKANFKILLVEDMASFREAVKRLLGVYNDVDEAADLDSARTLLHKGNYDVVVLDKGLPDGDGIDLIPEIKSLSPNTVVIVLTSDSDFSAVKHCIAQGADDYVVKSENVVPDLLVRIPVTVSRAASGRRLRSLEDQVREAFKYEIVGKAKSTIELRETILSLKGSGAHVLITGESGTGKELIARRLNAVDDDGKRPFVALNCGAISESLIESELFGHKKGSFTGALQDRPGKFELAHNGDLFLDEIGEMPLSAQVKLLRAIQEGEITRIGDSRVIKVKCRVIAATNRNLEELVGEGKFREDLYHRLNVFRIATKPLRQRKEDIADLAKLFVLQVGDSSFSINDAALRSLEHYDWPGNIRELRNTIERAIIMARKRGSRIVAFDDIIVHGPPESNSTRMKKIEACLPSDLSNLTPNQFKEFLLTVEREYYKAALELTNGSAVDLATRIGLGRSTIFKYLKKCGINHEGQRVNGPKVETDFSKFGLPKTQITRNLQ
ncbi:MAG: sigma-54-dependent Fis family transcriptional regulator [Bdellovibrionales bacterium]|nr:sigma-54-dependent Fis family transcriptional regulator [Bdellovibrionales bacterium]